MLPTLSASLAMLLFLPPARSQQEPRPPQDPEATETGRRSYLGREVAHTMHWSGAGWLMRKTREDEENGVLLRRWLAVQPGQAVCDLGCGNGYHTLPLAESVGNDGRVLAVDLQPQMLTMLKRRAQDRGLGNLDYIEATVDDPKLAAASCDLVLMVDVYHELSHPVRVMQRVRRALKPKGRVVLVEFRAEDPEVPIKPEHMMTKAQVIREMATHGFALAEECDDLPWQHAMAFGASASTGRTFAARQVLGGFLRARAGKDARIVAPFLAAELAAAKLPATPTATTIADFELREEKDGTVFATSPTVAITMRTDADGRWVVTAVRPTAKRTSFAAPVRVMAGGKPVRVPHPGYAAPGLHDVDADGRADLVVGQFKDGRVRVYPRQPDGSFGAGHWLQADGRPAEIPGVF